MDGAPSAPHHTASSPLTISIEGQPPMECIEDVVVGACGTEKALVLEAASLCGQLGLALAKWSSFGECGVEGQVVAFSCCPADSTCCWMGAGPAMAPVGACKRPLPSIACAAGAFVCCDTPEGPEVAAEAQCPWGSALDASLCEGACMKLASKGACADASFWEDWATGKCQLAGGAITELEFAGQCSQKGVFAGATAVCCGYPQTCCKTASGYTPADDGDCPGDAEVAWSYCEQAAKLGSAPPMSILVPSAAANKPNYAWQCWDGKPQCTNWGVGVSSGYCSDLPKPNCADKPKFLKPKYAWQCWNGKPRCTNWGVGVADGYCQDLSKPDCVDKPKFLKPKYAWQCWNGQPQCTNWGVGVSSGHCSDLPKPNCTPKPK